MAGPNSNKQKGKNTKGGFEKLTSQSKIDKSTSGKSLETKEQEKKKLETDLRKLDVILRDSQADYVLHQQKLAKAAEAYDNGADPEHKDELERLSQESDRMATIINGYKADLEQLKREQRQLEDMDGVEATGASDGGLFVEADKSKTSETAPDRVQAGQNVDEGQTVDGTGDAPKIDLTDPDGTRQSVEFDNSEDVALFTPADLQRVTGRGDEGTVMAWRMMGYSKQIIVCHGPPNARRYERSTAAKSGLMFDEDETEQFGPDHRLGDQKVGKKHVRKYHEFKGILGETYGGDLEDLRPKLKGDTRKFPQGEILVKWEIGGVIEKAWEVRASIKHLWANPSHCDEYIYYAAKQHRQQHQQWLDGQRPAKDKSPSPSTQMTGMMPQSKEVKTEKEISTISPVSPAKSTNIERMLEFKEEWSALRGLDSQKLSETQKAQFLAEWNSMKSKS